MRCHEWKNGTMEKWQISFLIDRFPMQSRTDHWYLVSVSLKRFSTVLSLSVVHR